MTATDLIPWISLVISIGVPVVVFVARNWLKARLEKGVQHNFDRKIEHLRAELRESEEKLKSRLRDRESEIATLRDTILAGSSARQTLVDKRRFDAVERIWTAVNDMARLKHISGMMALLKVEEVAKEIRDPRMKQVLAMLGAGAPAIDELKNVARDERPFVPELAWAYFSAYSSVLYGNYMLFKMLETGADEPTKFLKRDGNKDILKAALPHQSEWIDRVQPEAYHHLVDELQNNLLMELRKILEGVEVSVAEIEKARRILDAVMRAEPTANVSSPSH